MKSIDENVTVDGFKSGDIEMVEERVKGVEEIKVTGRGSRASCMASVEESMIATDIVEGDDSNERRGVKEKRGLEGDGE